MSGKTPSQGFLGSPWGRGLVLLGIVGVVYYLVAGRGRDWKKEGDNDIQIRLIGFHEKREAIPFFEQGGRYYDVEPDPEDETEPTTVDRDMVVPLLKRLKEISRTNQWVMLRHDDKNWAHALIIELPPDRKTIERMADAVEEADKQFSGFILQQWGYKWLSIIPIDNESYEFLKKNDPDLDKQRP